MTTTQSLNPLQELERKSLKKGLFLVRGEVQIGQSVTLLQGKYGFITSPLEGVLYINGSMFLLTSNSIYECKPQ